ncbi:MAG: hypothetical protein ACLQDQ_14505 [Myxococcaceae bacterium]
MRRRRLSQAVDFGDVATIATAIGAVAIGAFAIGTLAVGRVAVRRAKFKSLEIEDLAVTRLHAGELKVSGSLQFPGSEVERQVSQ